MRPLAVFSGFIILFLFSSCIQDEVLIIDPPLISYQNVDQALWAHYDNFLLEASKRNITVDLMGVSGEIASISDEGVAGTCQFGSHITNHVTIDKEFWNSASEIYREFVVFHELGHCVLDRGHREDADQNGRCLSIMRSGLTSCRDSYNLGSRSYFLDELFFVTD